MIQIEKYIFKDGRVGTNTYSDKLYKNIEKVDEDGKIIVEPIYYSIRKKGTTEIYARNSEKKEQAIDVLPFKYEEVTEEEMKQFVPDVKAEPISIEESEG